MRLALISGLIFLGACFTFCQQTYGDECDAILERAVTKFKYKSVSEFNKDFVRVLKVTRKEREEAEKDGSGSIKAIIYGLPVGADGKFKSKRMRDLHLMLEENEQLALKMLEEEQLSLEVLSPEAIKEWGGCKKRDGIQIRILGGETEGAEFIVCVSFTPRSEPDPKVVIEDIKVTSATPKGGGLVKGATLDRFSSLQSMYQRKGHEKVAVVITFKGYKEVTAELDALPSPEERARQKKELEDREAKRKAEEEEKRRVVEEEKKAFVRLYDAGGTYTGDEMQLQIRENVPDLSVRNFNNKTSKVKWYIPAGWKVTLYDAPGYQNPIKTLEGSGEIAELRGIADKTTSVRWEKK